MKPNEIRKKFIDFVYQNRSKALIPDKPIRKKRTEKPKKESGNNDSLGSNKPRESLISS